MASLLEHYERMLQPLAQVAARHPPMLNVLKFFLSTYVSLIGIALLLLIDSPTGDGWFSGHGQAIVNILALLIFVIFYGRSRKRVRVIMLVGMLVGFSGELYFSLLLGMYHYRLDNVPLWVAFGHGLIYWLAFKLTHNSYIEAIRPRMERLLLAFAVLYSLLWLKIADDWFGFLCTIVFLMVLFTARKSRFFFLLMFAIVAYIELIGTATDCWYWPATTFGIDGWLPSGNPPSGIAVFYFLFDAEVLFIYLYLIYPRKRPRFERRARKPRSGITAEPQLVE